MFLVMPTSVGVGFTPPLITCQAFLRGGAKLIGQVVNFDLRNTDAATLDNNTDGGSDSGFGNVVNLSSTFPNLGSDRQIVGVVMGPAGDSATSPAAKALGTSLADDSLATIGLYGVLSCAVYSGTSVTNMPIGSDLFVIGNLSQGALVSKGAATPATDSGVNLTVEIEYVAVGKLLAAVPDGDPSVYARVWFWGGLPFGVSQRQTGGA